MYFHQKRNSLPQRRKGGFTFVEILLVVSIISMLSLTIFNTFSSGLKIWNRGHRFVIEEDIAILLDKMTKELRNSFHFSQIDFKGRSNRLIFPTIVTTLVDSKVAFGKTDYIKQIGAVEYEFNVSKNSLYRREANYSQATKGNFPQKRLILSDVKKVEFQYFYISKGGQLQPMNAVNELPQLIRVDIEYSDQTGEISKISKLIDIKVDLPQEEDEKI